MNTIIPQPELHCTNVSNSKTQFHRLCLELCQGSGEVLIRKMIGLIKKKLNLAVSHYDIK